MAGAAVSTARNHVKIAAVSRCACIDIGTNTTRLLVAELDGRRIAELASERAFTLLGAAGAASGEVGRAKIEEVAAVVARQVHQAEELGAQALRVVATAAVREAVDRAALAAAIDAACGARLEILDAADEARLAFAGAIGTLADPPAGVLAVVDVGGGSTELVVGSAAGGVTWAVSLPVGSSLVMHADLPSDPPTRDELSRARATIDALFASVRPPRPAIAYAVGGSATSLHGLVGAELGGEALAGGLDALVSGPAAAVALRLELHVERVRLLPAGILLLDAAARALGVPLRLAGGGVREGVVLELLAAREAG